MKNEKKGRYLLRIAMMGGYMHEVYSDDYEELEREGEKETGRNPWSITDLKKSNLKHKQETGMVFRFETVDCAGQFINAYCEIDEPFIDKFELYGRGLEKAGRRTSENSIVLDEERGIYIDQDDLDAQLYNENDRKQE